MIPGTVKSITVSGVYGQGDYNLSNASWTSLANPSTYVIKLDASVKAGESKALTGGENDNKVLMMIPQPFGADADAKVSMVFNDGAKDKTVSFRLHNTSWEAGKHITYVLSSSKITTLNMGSLTYPTGWNSVNEGTTNQIRTAYDPSNTSAGLFVVNEEKKVIAANVQLTLSGTSWSLPAGSKLKFSPQYNYFVYYPYQSEGLPGAPAKDTPNIDVTSAEIFFDDAIDTWKSNKIATDQSTLDKMNACDLQIGKASLDDDGCSVSFEMKHAMGLAEIVLGKTSFTNSICYLVGYEEYPTWNGTTTSYASSSIKNHTMYGIADHRYVSIVKPGENSFMSNTDKDAWKEEVKLSPAANEVKSGTAYNSINPTTPHAYTLAVGDIYYSDGAISHQEDDLISTSGRIPIGIVGYITMNGDGNYWTEKDTKEKGIGGHALVMCLKNIGSNGTTHLGSSYQWKSSNTDNGRTKVTTAQMIRESYKEQYGSGYRETIALSTSCYPANAAMNYNTLSAPEHICTGWFLPTVGQYYAILMQLGGGIIPDTWQVRDFFGNQYKLTTNVNNALKKIGYNNYSEFFQANCTNIHTSTEFDSQRTIRMDSGVDDGLGSGSIRFVEVLKYYSTTITGVRPFLAF